MGAPASRVTEGGTRMSSWEEAMERARRYAGQDRRRYMVFGYRPAGHSRWQYFVRPASA